VESYIKEMLLALEANIEYLRQEGSAQLRVKNGQLLNSVGDVYIYEFTLEFFQNVEPDTDVEVRVRSESANGRVVAINDKSIQVELDKNIGATIPEARLIISSYYLIQLLYEKLKKVDNGELKLTDLAEKTFKLKPANIASPEYRIPEFSVTNLANSSQESAIKLALGSEVSFIWGPPGTGKTETIARLIEGFLSKTLSVLLISHTNVATDGALLNVVRHLKDSDDYRDGKFLREGAIQKPELKAYEMVVPAVVLEKKGSPIKREIETLTKRIDEISLVVSTSETIIKNFQKIEASKREEDNIKGDISSKENGVVSAKLILSNIETQFSDIEDKIQRYQSKGTLGRFFSGLNLEKLIRLKSALLIQKDKEAQKLSAYAQTISIAKTKLQNFIEGRKELEAELHGESLDRHKKVMEQVKKELQNLKEQRNLLITQLEALANTLMKEAKVIATTLTKSYSSQIILNREYDCVVLDEASMAPLPALWCAAGLAKQKVVIVGDFYQLPPIAKHKVVRRKDKSEEEIRIEEALVEKWLKKDIFDVSGIFSAIRSGEKPPWLEQLKIQYRMHPDIAGAVNKLVYGTSGKRFELDSGPNTYNNGKERLTTLPLENAHIGIYDTSKIGSLPSRTDSGSYYNLYQAFLAVSLAKQAVENGYNSVGIISPFRPQTNLIQKIVQDENLNLKIEADTVHRFQGGEKQIIIFDTTTAQPTKLTDDQREGGDDEKLLNVAFSRAQEKCIVITDIQTIEKKHSLTSLLRKFIQYCQEKNFPIIPSEGVLPKYSVSEKTEQWLRQINNINDLAGDFENSQLFNERDFYQNFIRDLLEAKQEVVIDSPYITTERVRILTPVLEHLINKGVKIFVLTRQPKEHGPGMKYQAADEIRNFESLGISVLPFIGYVHRKLAIIDRSILWEGSLNILSQRDSHEIMRRFAGKETAQQMMAFLKLDKNLGKIGENKLQRCEFCQEPGAWYWTDKSIYGGLWTFCLIGGHKLGAEPKSKEERSQIKKKVRKLRKMKKEATSEGTPICPKHDLAMIKRQGPYGQFWGCPKYPACRVTDKMT
jgi:superfamily I DNA and/or RNA helicase